MDVVENWKATLEVEYAKDKFSCEIFDGTNNDDRYKVLEGIIYYKCRIYLVPNLSLKEEIIKKAHDSPPVGHPDFFKTYRMLRERFSWKGMKDDVIKYVNEFPTWKENKVVFDALSRRPSISVMDVAKNWKATLEVEYVKDKFSCELFYGNNHDDRYKVLKVIIYYKYI